MAAVHKMTHTALSFHSGTLRAICILYIMLNGQGLCQRFGARWKDITLGSGPSQPCTFTVTTSLEPNNQPPYIKDLHNTVQSLKLTFQVCDREQHYFRYIRLLFMEGKQ